MKLFLLLFAIAFQVSYSILEEAFSKTICSMKRLSQTDIYFGTELSLDKFILSKKLFQKCDFRVRMISDIHALRKNDLIAFAYHEKDIKVLQISKKDCKLLIGSIMQ